MDGFVRPECRAAELQRVNDRVPSFAAGTASGGEGKEWLSVPVVLSTGPVLEFTTPLEAQ